MQGTPMRSPMVSPKTSTSSGKASPMKSPVTNSTSESRQNQLNSEVMKPPPSSSQYPNGQSSNMQRGKTTNTSSKASPMRVPIVSPKSSTSPGKVSPMKSPVTNTKQPSPLNDLSRQVSRQNLSASVKEEVCSVKRETTSSFDEEDSEDDKPLSSRMKGSSSNGNKVASASAHVKDEDPDDEVPICMRYATTSASKASGTKPNSSIVKKTLSSKVQLNGSTIKDRQQKSPVVSTKRPVDKVSIDQSSAKRPKLSDTPTTTKVKQTSVKAEVKTDDDHLPISQRMKPGSSSSKSSTSKQKLTKVVASTSKKIDKKKQMKNSMYSKSTKVQPGSSDGQKKWTTLEHNGVIFPPPYKPHGVRICYKGKAVDLTPAQEEVATMFAVMKDTDYIQKPKFLENFWNDWKKILGRNHVIQSLEDCDFGPIYDWHQEEKEKKKQMSTEEKKTLKEDKLKQEEKFMWAIVDGVKEKVGNFRVEPPGLFRGRGEHPKMGKLKKRIRPSDITINIGKGAPIPECPISGESWKEIKHDNTVTWLAFWNDPINPKDFKYVNLAASSSIKGQSDKEKYEKARKLKDYIHNIRAAYTKDFTSKDVQKRQIAVATYLIDKLALRAGNEKDDEEADTVGCCTLKVANVECAPPNMLKFDFLGKDSIRYENTVEVELPVYKAIGQFQTRKKATDDLFDLLDTSKLNAHLKELMPGLTAKVFRTYNASITLDGQLYEGTEEGSLNEKIGVYLKANKQVAIICNHQRSISKSHGAQMSKLTEKIDELKVILKDLEIDMDRAKRGKLSSMGSDGKQKKRLTPEVIAKKIESTNIKIEKFELAMQSKEDLKTVALGTSKINYLDPRITVAWCKRHDVPIEKIFNKSLLAKFAWAMDVDPQFRF